MSIELSPENSRFISQLVERGVYASESLALADAVWLLRKREELRSEVLAGIEQADRGQLLPAEEVFERLERRAQQIERSARGK